MSFKDNGNGKLYCVGEGKVIGREERKWKCRESSKGRWGGGRRETGEESGEGKGREKGQEESKRGEQRKRGERRRRDGKTERERIVFSIQYSEENNGSICVSKLFQITNIYNFFFLKFALNVPAF